MSNLTGQKIERFGDKEMKRQLELVAAVNPQINQSSSNILYKPTVVNQNVVAYMNGKENDSVSRKSSQFLPTINDAK